MASFSQLLNILSFPIFLAFFLGLLLQPSQATLNRTEFVNQILEGHNNARQIVGVPPLKYEPLLARYARIYSNDRRQDCKLIHSRGFKFGENLFWGQGLGWNAKNAVDAWVDEKKWYNYDNNSCSGIECTHYTQIVWRTTKRVGCAQIICDSGDVFITCEYYPPGNYIGARPY
ncbi:hypothetical protein ACHQM5_015806 [Ranunculus cassubicifolius]